MRKIIFSILIAFVPLVTAQSAPQLAVQSEPDYVTLRYAKEMMVKSQVTERSYRIQTALLGPEPEAGYPVLFVLDGDAYFSSVASLANALSESNANPNALSVLIVGVGYSDQQAIDLKQRSLDYTPPLRSEATDEERHRYGQGALFRQFLNQELIDYLASQYRIDTESLALFGHSFGGLYSLYDLLSEDSRFSYFVLSSPSIWWHDTRILDFAEDLHQAHGKHVRITIGELEIEAAQKDARRRSRDMAGHARRLYERLNAEGVAVEFAIYPDETHGTVAYKSVLDSLPFLQKNLR